MPHALDMGGGSAALRHPRAPGSPSQVWAFPGLSHAGAASGASRQGPWRSPSKPALGQPGGAGGGLDVAGAWLRAALSISTQQQPFPVSSGAQLAALH